MTGFTPFDLDISGGHTRVCRSMTLLQIRFRLVDPGRQISHSLVNIHTLRFKNISRSLSFARGSIFVFFVAHGLQYPELTLEFLLNCCQVTLVVGSTLIQAAVVRRIGGRADSGDTVFQLQQTITEFPRDPFLLVSRFCFMAEMNFLLLLSFAFIQFFHSLPNYMQLIPGVRALRTEKLKFRHLRFESDCGSH